MEKYWPCKQMCASRIFHYPLCRLSIGKNWLKRTQHTLRYVLIPRQKNSRIICWQNNNAGGIKDYTKRGLRGVYSRLCEIHAGDNGDNGTGTLHSDGNWLLPRMSTPNCTRGNERLSRLDAGFIFYYVAQASAPLLASGRGPRALIKICTAVAGWSRFIAQFAADLRN
jgi:hypothetical protein